MKIKINNLALVASLLAALGFMSNAQAAGTLAGTSISNTANLAYSIGSVAQTPVASNTVSFVVDNKVNALLVEDQAGAATVVTPGASNQIIKFKLTNLGNAPQDYSFSTSMLASGASLYSRTDNFDATACQVFVDSAANNGVYDSGVDTASYVDELAPDTSKSIFLRCNIPATQVNNDFSVSNLIATTLAGGSAGVQGAVVAQTTGANTAGIDIVFADAAGTDDSARDGKTSARGAYLVQAATLSFVKSSAPICDPINFTANPKAIPGSFVRYSIVITNSPTAGSSATLGNLTDVIDTTNLTFDPNLILPTSSSCSSATAPESAAGRSFKVSCTGGTRSCTTTPLYKTAAPGDDGFDFTTNTITAGFTQALAAEAGYTAGELKVGESVKLEFNVEVK